MIVDLCAGLPRRLITDPRLAPAVTGQQVQDGVGDPLVNRTQHALVQRRLGQLQLKHFQLGHGAAGRQVGGGGRDLAAPPDGVDLPDKNAAEAGKFSMMIPPASDDGQETDQFKIFQSGHLGEQRRGAAGREQAVNIALRLGVHDGVDGLAEQPGDGAHAAAVFGALVEHPIGMRDGLVLPAAEQPLGVQQALDVLVSHLLHDLL